MEVSGDRAEPRQEGALDVFFLPKDPIVTLALLKDPRA